MSIKNDRSHDEMVQIRQNILKFAMQIVLPTNQNRHRPLKIYFSSNKYFIFFSTMEMNVNVMLSSLN